MSDIREAQINFSATDVTLVTTAETVIVSSGPVVAPFQTHRVVILAWGQLVTGAATTTVTPRIRRGTATSGSLVWEANAVEVKAAAGSREPFFIMVSEARAGEESVEYSLTLAQASATGNGTVSQAAILVLVL